MAEQQLNEVSCMKAVNGPNFSQGLQEYPFCIGRPNGFLPSQSYFRIKMKVTGAGGNIPTIAQKIAFADNCASNLYSNVNFRGGGQDISSIVSYVAQASQMKNRIQKTKAWTDSIGKGAYMFNPSFRERAELTSSGVYKAHDSFNNFRAGPLGCTVALATNTTLTGTNTLFVTEGVAPGDQIYFPGPDKLYTVNAVDDEDTLTVVETVAAAIAATIDFVFIKNPTQLETGKNSIYVIWRPPIGIMDHEDALGAGEYKFSLNPNADYKKSVVQSAADLAVGVGFDVEIQDVKLYVATAKLELFDDEYELDLMEMNVQSKMLTPDTSNNQFTIPSSTKHISIFTQANSSGTNTMYPPSLFRTAGGQEKALTSIQLNYANLVKPNSRWDSVFSVADNTNQWQQRYVDNLRECGMINCVGGAESYSEFLERGVFVHYAFDRDESDKSTQLQLSTTFTGITGGAFAEPTKIFVVCHYRRKVQIQVNNGMIVAVRSLTA